MTKKLFTFPATRLSGMHPYASPLSERIRKRRAFADKSLEDILYRTPQGSYNLPREYQQAENNQTLAMQTISKTANDQLKETQKPTLSTPGDRCCPPSALTTPEDEAYLSSLLYLRPQLHNGFALNDHYRNYLLKLMCIQQNFDAQFGIGGSHRTNLMPNLHQFPQNLNYFSKYWRNQAPENILNFASSFNSSICIPRSNPSDLQTKYTEWLNSLQRQHSTPSPHSSSECSSPESIPSSSPKVRSDIYPKSNDFSVASIIGKS